MELSWDFRPTRFDDARPINRWIVSADLGQSVDPTAICVLHHSVTPLATWTKIPERNLQRQDRVERYDVRHLERLPLGWPYPEQVQYVANILSRPPLAALKPELVIDQTGVGAAVGDIFDVAGLRPVRISITAGKEATRQPAGWHCAKSILISGLDAALHLKTLRIAAKLSDAGALQEELKDFQRSVSAAGRATYAARVGKHDDLVLAVAIAIFAATNRNGFTQEELRL